MLSTTPDQLCSLAAYVSREWGDYGYRFTRLESPTYLVTLATVRCSDGSEFQVVADRWGNCRPVPEGLSAEQVTKLVWELHQASARRGPCRP